MMKERKGHRFAWPVAILGIALLALGPAVVAQNPVEVAFDSTGDAIPGGTVTIEADITVNDGSTVGTTTWTQLFGEEALIAGANTTTVMVTLGSDEAYRDRLIELALEPPVGADQLPPNVRPPEGEFVGGLQNRFQIVGTSPFLLEETALVVLELEVVTTSGTYDFEYEIHTHIAWKPAAGIRNVPVGLPVQLHGKDQESYDWDLDVPAGSATMLMYPASQDPVFIPDTAGLFTVTVTDNSGDDPVEVVLDIYVGTWLGVIVGQDADGRPIADGACLTCHNDNIAPDVFTPWAQTGHAEIFTDLLDTNTHYGPNCFGCHTVGFDTDVANGGFDDDPNYEDFLAAGLLNNPGDNWTTVLADYPSLARLANIQCENCHGPQTSAAHATGNEARVSLSSDVCGACHGEPPRHGRFQQWQLSPHANYELAIDEGESGSCSRCHTANGFLAWLPILLDDDPATDPTASIEVTWTADETHPQTCQTCHDPHAIGTQSGEPNNATVRISGDTPPLIAGFTATDVGRGAICMTCHNTRRGLRNDSNFGEIYQTSEAARAPHGGAQADLLMGQNAYFVQVGNRGNHSITFEQANGLKPVADTCATCHMEETPPPAILSYNQGGTNHTFVPSTEICANCHNSDIAPIIQGNTASSLAVLEDLIEQAIFDLMTDQIRLGNSVDVDGRIVTDTAEIADIQFGESHGRQAITVSFTDMEVVGPVSMNDVEVVPPSGEPFDLYDAASPNLPKSGWNYLLVANDGSLGAHNPTFAMNVLDQAIENIQSDVTGCLGGPTEACVQAGRFSVSVAWSFPPQFPDPAPAMVSSLNTDDSAIFFFNNPDNLEFLIKVLDGCSTNNRYWVFFAGTTNVEFTVTVTDTETGAMKVYTNPLGNPADAVTDTGAFATCP